MRYLIYLLLLCCSLAATEAVAQQKNKPTAKPAVKTTAAEPQMKTYYMVFLKKGPTRNQDSATAATIQAGHMANIQKLAAAKKLKVAGPFLDDGDLRGISILDVPSLEEAKRLTDADPAVQAGRLIMKIHPWMTQKGTVID
ncbi:MAG: YciI family protein [Adhaeribacter sp.]